MEFLLLIIILAVAFSLFWIWMFIDCLFSPLPQAEKLLWLLIIFFTHFIGAFLYCLMARGQGRSVI